MRVLYKILYKNGLDETFDEIAPEEQHDELLNTFNKCFLEDKAGVIRMSCGEGCTRLIRVSDVSRVEMAVLWDSVEVN